MEYAQFEYCLSAVLLVLSMTGMGAALTAREFINVVKAPKGVLLVALAQFVITPLLAILFAKAFSLPTGIAVGFLLVTALPGGSFSNLLTFLGKGNVVLSITATAVCTVTCLVATPSILRLLGAAQLPDNFTMPVVRIVGEIAFFLLAPLLMGMVVRRIWPQHWGWFSRFLLRASTVLLAVFIVCALSSGRIQVTAYGWRTPLALILYTFAALWVAYLLGLSFRLSLDDIYTIGIEIVVRNTGLGLLLKAAIFPATEQADPIGDGVLFVILFYAGCSLSFAVAEALMKRNEFGGMYGKKRGQARVRME